MSISISSFQDDVPKFLVSSKTKRYSVNGHTAGKKPDGIHILKDGISLFFLLEKKLVIILWLGGNIGAIHCFVVAALGEKVKLPVAPHEK